ncbi:MAG TPA: hypothetical protein VFX12_00265 [Vicinamibacterales bacterium]|nr:hypothetical protein [Vicinamibacterales bacterium]
MSHTTSVEPSSARPDTHDGSVPQPLVLLADANASTRTRRTRQIRTRGFRIALARTGFETIVKASCQLPDLILIDGALEAETSATMALLGSCPATAHIPVVCVTSGRPVPGRVLAELQQAVR